MDEAMQQEKLTYGYETTNLGRYVSTINGRELLAPNGWMFTINGVLSNLGVSTATLSDGDTLLWYEGMTQNHFRAPRVEELGRRLRRLDGNFVRKRAARAGGKSGCRSARRQLPADAGY